MELLWLKHLHGILGQSEKSMENPEIEHMKNLLTNIVCLSNDSKMNFYFLFLLFNYSHTHFPPITLSCATHTHLPHLILPLGVFVNGSFIHVP